MLKGFDVATAAQSAAFFIREEGGRIDYLKLVKLMYLAERESMAKYDKPMFYDVFFNMDHGPIPSTVMDLLNHEIEHPVWSEFVGARVGDDVESGDNAELDHLSSAEKGILEGLAKKFAKMSGFKMALWTHEHCDEWRPPAGRKRTPLSHQTIFRELGKPNAIALEGQVRDLRAQRITPPRIRLDDARWRVFNEALDRPARTTKEMPGLARLMADKSVLE